MRIAEEGASPWPSITNRTEIVGIKEREDDALEIDDAPPEEDGEDDREKRPIGIDGLRRWGRVLVSNRRAGIGEEGGRINTYQIYKDDDPLLGSPSIHVFADKMPKPVSVKFAREGNSVYFYIYVRGMDGKNRLQPGWRKAESVPI